MKANKEMQEGTKQQMAGDKQIKRSEFLGFLMIAVLSFSFLFLHHQGITLWEISPGKSLVRFLAILFLILLSFRVLSRVVTLFFGLRHRPRGEATMEVRFFKSLTGLVIFLALIESMGKITIFGAIGAGFVGMLLAWSVMSLISERCIRCLTRLEEQWERKRQ